MKILEELFYGNVDETSRRIDATLKAKRKKEVELINESDLQIVMNYNTAIKLNKLLNKYISKNK